MKLERKFNKQLQKRANPQPALFLPPKGRKGQRKGKQTSSLSPIQGVVSAFCGQKNSHLSLTDFQGRTLLSMSAGELPLVKKSSAFAGLRLGESLGKAALEKGYRDLELRIRGFGRGRATIPRGLQNAGLRIRKISQNLGLAHNGCRPKKKRRL